MALNRDIENAFTAIIAVMILIIIFPVFLRIEDITKNLAQMFTFVIYAMFVLYVIRIIMKIIER